MVEKKNIQTLPLCSETKAAYVQWNLRITDTLGARLLSLYIRTLHVLWWEIRLNLLFLATSSTRMPTKHVLKHKACPYLPGIHYYAVENVIILVITAPPPPSPPRDNINIEWYNKYEGHDVSIDQSNCPEWFELWQHLYTCRQHMDMDSRYRMCVLTLLAQALHRKAQGTRLLVASLEAKRLVSTSN